MIDRAALVTGAASGIGRAVACALAKRGVGGLVLIDRDAEGLDDVIGELGSTPVLRLVHDVTDEAAWEASEAAVREHFGTLGEAVVDAGVAGGAPLIDTTLADWRKVLAVNLDGAMLTLRTAMRLMGADDTRGHAGGGAIVTVCSAAGMKAIPGTGSYGASKAALLQLTRIAAREGAAAGIRVNAVCPGGVETPIWRQSPGWEAAVSAHDGEAGAFAAIGAMTPLARFATAAEVARDVLHLLAPSVTTGAQLVNDGGFSL